MPVTHRSKEQEAEVVVVGGGPGGAAAAAFMARAGLQVVLVDKDTFPRDKICGDAISGKSIDVLRRLGLVEQVQATEQVHTWGVTFSGPQGDAVSIPFAKGRRHGDPLGFVCARTVFDEVVYQAAVGAGVTVWQGEVQDLLWEDGRVAGVQLRTKGGKERRTNGAEDADDLELRAPLVVGADGAYSVVARRLGMTQLDERHYCAGLRAYYQGVTGFHDGDFLEVHFLDEVIPGYFWIFPLPGGGANVGVGMLSRALKKRGVNLKALLDVCVAHPRFRDRFAGARRLGAVKGWGLPLGSRPRPMAGDGWLLVGDAASLIDPFSGEGIGNAMVSGEQAAQWAVRAAEAGDFSKAFLKGYERDVLHYLRGELRLSHAMQRLLGWKGLLNLVLRKAGRSPAVADAISVMFDDESQRRKLVSPLFYLRLLTA